MLFEFKVTGTLNDPKEESVYDVTRIPGLFLSPLQTIRDIMPGEKSKGTNQPPAQIKQDPPPEPHPPLRDNRP